MTLEYLIEHWILAFTVCTGLILLFAMLQFGPTADVPAVEAGVPPPLSELGKAGLWGDYIGGMLGTIFTLFSVGALLSTLTTQITSAKIQNFETRYYELVKLHRDNVAEFELGEHSGRKVFVSMVREFQGILKEVHRFCKNQGKNLDQETAVHFAYYAFFFGVGRNSSRMLKSSLRDFDVAYPGLVDALEEHLRSKEIRRRISAAEELEYLAIDGHQSRLGHYYRHLYQSITYVHYEEAPVKKLEFVKTIRAQLTNYEQAMLFINSRTPLGKN